MGTEIARVPIRIVAYDAPGAGNRVRLFATMLGVSDVAVSQAPDEGVVRVGLHRRETVSAETGEPTVLDGAYLAVEMVEVELDQPLGDRRVVDHVTGDPVPTVEGAAKRGRDGGAVARAVAEAAGGEPVTRWRRPPAER